MKRKGISKSLRFKVLERDGFVCMYCGASAKESKLEIDHILPVSKGGKNKLNNLITSCFECNRGKSARLTKLVLPISIKIVDLLKMIIREDFNKLDQQTKDIRLIYDTKYPKYKLEKKFYKGILKVIKEVGHDNALRIMQYYCEKCNDFHDAILNFSFYEFEFNHLKKQA